MDSEHLKPFAEVLGVLAFMNSLIGWLLMLGLVLIVAVPVAMLARRYFRGTNPHPDPIRTKIRQKFLDDLADDR